MLSLYELQSDRSTKSNRKGNGTVPEVECTEGVAAISSRWKSGNTRVKLDAVQIMKQSHQAAKKRCEKKDDISTTAELDKIKAINKWLSIKVCFSRTKHPFLMLNPDF